jgi:putative membrane protein
MRTESLPLFNAVFNSLSTICLIFGYYSIRKKREETHKRFMISAFIFSSIFLVGYLTYHYHHGSSHFPDLGWIKTLYLVILVPHVILAAVMVPLILITFYHALKDHREKHRRWARITFPIWLYVSVTGVIIYLMVHRLFKV